MVARRQKIRLLSSKLRQKQNELDFFLSILKLQSEDFSFTLNELNSIKWFFWGHRWGKCPGWTQLWAMVTSNVQEDKNCRNSFFLSQIRVSSNAIGPNFRHLFSFPVVNFIFVFWLFQTSIQFTANFRQFSRTEYNRRRQSATTGWFSGIGMWWKFWVSVKGEKTDAENKLN